VAVDNERKRMKEKCVRTHDIDDVASGALLLLLLLQLLLPLLLLGKLPFLLVLWR
jgi:hypothetical protein